MKAGKTEVARKFDLLYLFLEAMWEEDLPTFTQPPLANTGMQPTAPRGRVRRG